MALNQSARIPELKGNKEGLELGVLKAEMQEIRKLLEMSTHARNRGPRRDSISTLEFERISNTLDKLQSAKRVPSSERMEGFHMLMRETEELMMRCEDKADHMHFRHLMDRIHRAASEVA